MNTHHIRKGTRSCICHKGSYTLEAAVILPLLAGFFVFLLLFFRVLQVQTQVQTALYYAARKTACEAGALEAKPALMASAEAHFFKEIKQYDAVDRYVAGGIYGISLLGSDISGSYVKLKTVYYIKLPINFFGIRGILISQEAKSRKWTGDGQDKATEDYVYVTEHGSVYHRSRDCNYLDLSIRAVDADTLDGQRNKSGHTYGACSECAARGTKTGMVYVTDYGICYHTDLSCSGLKRTIYLIPLSEVGGLGPCTKCGQGLNK